MILLFLLSKLLLHLPSEVKASHVCSWIRLEDREMKTSNPINRGAHLKARQRFKFLAPGWMESPELGKKPTYIVKPGKNKMSQERT